MSYDVVVSTDYDVAVLLEPGTDLAISADSDVETINVSEQGPPGPVGTPGANGLDGNTVLYGASDPPNTLGLDGNFYINTITHFMFGPKSGGLWPAGTSLVGPQGPSGLIAEAPIDGATYGRVGLTASWNKALPLAGTTQKSTQLGTNSGTTVVSNPPATTDANVLLYNTSSTNWCGIGTDSSGFYWVRTGTSGTPLPAFYVDTSQIVHFLNPPLGLGVSVPRSYLAGLTLSTAGSSTTFTVAAGIAANSTNVDLVTLTSSISKTTAFFAAGTGNGAFDTNSAVVINTWYHVYLIKRTDTGAVDVLFSASPSAPTMPSPYTEFRRIGSMKTNASSQWTAFTQNGNEFLWLLPINDANAVASGTGTTARTLTVPTGVQVWAKFIGLLNYVSAGVQAVFSPLDMGTQTPNTPVGYYHMSVASAQTIGIMELMMRTNSTAQVNIALNAAGANYYITTYGWIDTRGRDS